MLKVACKILHICVLRGFKNYQALVTVIKSSLIRFVNKVMLEIIIFNGK